MEGVFSSTSAGLVSIDGLSMIDVAGSA